MSGSDVITRNALRLALRVLRKKLRTRIKKKLNVIIDCPLDCSTVSPSCVEWRKPHPDKLHGSKVIAKKPRAPAAPEVGNSHTLHISVANRREAKNFQGTVSYQKLHYDFDKFWKAARGYLGATCVQRKSKSNIWFRSYSNVIKYGERPNSCRKHTRFDGTAICDLR
jgi:hypothetical protein